MVHMLFWLNVDSFTESEEHNSWPMHALFTNKEHISHTW
jgi:hypothetical protein